MAGLQSYLNPDEELDPAKASMADYLAVSQAQLPQSATGLKALNRYMDLANKAAAEERAGVEQLQQYATDYQNAPREIDWTPLAAFVQSHRPQSKIYDLMKGSRPETDTERAEKMMRLQDLIQQRKGALTGRELSAAGLGLKQQLAMEQAAQAKLAKEAEFQQKQLMAEEKRKFDEQLAKDRLEQERERTQAYKEQGLMRKEIAQMQLEAARTAKEEAQNRADERQRQGLEQKNEKMIADQVVKLGKDFSGDMIGLTGAVKDIEDIIGAPLDYYDPKTKTLAGKKVDLPGKSVPGLGRVFMPGSQGERLASAHSAILNNLLKARSGAAVTENEYARLRQELGTGKFNTEEQFLESLQRYKKTLKEILQQRERSYKKESVESFRGQGGKLTEDLMPTVPNLYPAEDVREWNGKKFKRQGDTWVEVTE